MTRRKPRATPATVTRWLREGIAPKTFERLVEDLAPSARAARDWQRKGIPERVLRELKPPPAKKKAKAPVRGPRAGRDVPGFVRPPFPEGTRFEEPEETPAPPRRRAAPRKVLTEEQAAGMRRLGLSEDQISAVGRVETEDERDARREREAIQESEGTAPPRERTPLEIEQARELSRLRAEVERLARMIEGPPKLAEEAPSEPMKPFQFDTEPRPGEDEERWLTRIGEDIIAEARTERPGENALDRGERLVNTIRTALHETEGVELMDLVAEVIAEESGMSNRDVYTLYHSPGSIGR